MSNETKLQEAAEALGADFEVANVRSIALHNAAVAMVGPAGRPEVEVQVLLLGALAMACRHVGTDQLAAFDHAIATLQDARRNTERVLAEEAERQESGAQ